jgi:hypothetical protein
MELHSFALSAPVSRAADAYDAPCELLLPVAAEHFSPAPEGAGMIAERVLHSRQHNSGKQQKTLFAKTPWKFLL